MSSVKPPACAPEKHFWLEVTGKQTLAGHTYLLRDAPGDNGEGGGAEKPLAQCGQYTGRMGPILKVELERRRKRSLILQLQGEETIEAPLIDDEALGPHRINPPQREYQGNLMVSVHPTLYCDAGELTRPRPLTGYEEAIPAPLRTGWIYVFFKGRLWRELLVRAEAGKAPMLQDTAVARARAASLDAANDRPAKGPALDAIQVPARLNGATVYGDVQLAFSETQWSWQYILDLEREASHRRERTRHGGALRGFLRRLPALCEDDWKPVDDLPPMRSRNHAVERDGTLPSRWLQDLDGAKTGEDQKALIAQRDAIEADQQVVAADYYIATPTLYPRWRQNHLEAKEQPAIEAGTDVFESLRGRDLVTLTLRDTLQSARHLVQLVNASQSLLLALVTNVKKRPFGATAELFHNQFRRAVLPDGSANPLHFEKGWLFDDRLDDSDEGRLKRTLYDVERIAARSFIADAQAALARLLKDKRGENLTATLRDLFALERGNAIAGYFQAGPLLQVLSLPAHRSDPLILPQEVDAGVSEDANTLALAIAAGDHPLGVMLLPFKTLASECRAGDATTTNLKAMAASLDNQGEDLRALEANVVREMAAHLADSKGPDSDALVGGARIASNAFSAIAGEVGQWWLNTVQAELQAKGAAFKAEASRIKGAFEGFAEAAIPGKTTVQLEDAGEADNTRTYIVLEVLDEQGNTLTSGAAIGAALRVADVDAFDGTIKNQRVKRWVHQTTTSPAGLPGILVAFDVWNFYVVTNSIEINARSIMGFTSAAGDLLISTGQLVSSLPQNSISRSAPLAVLKSDANWFTTMASKIKVGADVAEEVVRSNLDAVGWIAGMFTSALMVSDSVASFTNGRWGVGSAQLVKAGGMATMASNDIIAARILTPAGRRAVERKSVQALQGALARLAPRVAGWSGTVASGWVTAIGFAIYVVGEAAYYRLVDDAISEWLRAGPFSGDPDDQTKALSSESDAYIALVKAMTPTSFERIGGNDLQDWLVKNNRKIWQGEAESVLTFASPALAITGEPAEVEIDLTYKQRKYRIRGVGPGGAPAETIREESGRIGKALEEDYDENRHAIDFMITKAQLPAMKAHSPDERVETTYAVKRLSLTFTVDVWQRESEQYEGQKVTNVMEDLDVEWKR